MSYIIKEIFLSLQGEGYYTGRTAIFCRFAGCNLWSGHEKDRAHAICNFCDTDFVGTDGQNGGKYEVSDLVTKMSQLWDEKVGVSKAERFVVMTGGEPALQLDEALVAALKNEGFYVAIETNGTRELPPNLDWICLSPKAGSQIQLHEGDELKLVFPQAELDPICYKGLSFKFFFLQPKDGPNLKENTERALDYCLTHPQWRLSLQTHKILNIE